MKRFLALLRSMPKPILVLFVVFAVMPILSLTFIRMPGDIYRTEGAWSAALSVLTYWVAPLLICYAMIFKRFLFLPFYVLQSAVLFLHAFANSQAQPIDMQIARYAVVGVMTYIGVVFSNKDLLFPFLSRNQRLWRLSMRFPVNLSVDVFGEGQESSKIAGKVENCSVTGMAVSLESASFTNAKGDRLVVVAEWEGTKYRVPSEVIWVSAPDVSKKDLKKIGLRVFDVDTMYNLVTSVTGEILPHPTKGGVKTLLKEQEIRTTALTLWVLFIALSFGLPAFA